MERLTTRVEDKVYYSKGEYPPTTLCAEMETWEVRECMKKLAEYEDLGLSPEEIKELQDQVEVLTDTVNMLSPLMVENFELKKEEREREYEKHTYKQKHDEVDPMQCVECGWESTDNCKICRADRERSK